MSSSSTAKVGTARPTLEMFTARAPRPTWLAPQRERQPEQDREHSGGRGEEQVLAEPVPDPFLTLPVGGVLEPGDDALEHVEHG